MSMLQEKPSVLKREHPALFVGLFAGLPSVSTTLAARQWLHITEYYTKLMISSQYPRKKTK
jgi:hypothetical protein